MEAASYPSPQWFDTAQTPRAGSCSGADLVVEHRCAGAYGQAHIHQQAFRGDELVGWAAGTPFGEAHIVLHRTIAADAADLFGQADPAAAAATSIEVGGVEAGLFGFEGFARDGLAALTGGAPPVDIAVAAAASPFGDTDIALRLHADGRIETIASDSAEADPDMSISGDWGDFARWSLDGEYLVWLITEKRVRLSGDFHLQAYLEGFVLWPKTESEQQWAHKFHSLTSQYRRCRQHPQYQQNLDRIAPRNTQESPPHSHVGSEKTTKEDRR